MDTLEELLGLVREYFRCKDIPNGWGFGKEKRESETALRKKQEELDVLLDQLEGSSEVPALKVRRNNLE